MLCLDGIISVCFTSNPQGMHISTSLISDVRYVIVFLALASVVSLSLRQSLIFLFKCFHLNKTWLQSIKRAEPRVNLPQVLSVLAHFTNPPQGAWGRIPTGACEKVATDLGLGGGFRRGLRFPPPVTTA